MTTINFRAVDTHCHLDLYRNRMGVLEGAVQAEILTVAVSSRPSQYRSLTDRFADHPGVRIALGFHPELAGSYDEPHELTIFRDHFAEARWIAEIGLDGEFVGVPTFPKQQRVFEEIMSLGITDKVLSVHSKAAQARVVDLLVAAEARAVILHWWSGTEEVARRALDRGFYFSINCAMLDTTTDIDFVRWLPAERLLFETDGPFVMWQGQPAEPKHVLEFARRIAEIRGVSVEELLMQTKQNFTQLETLAEE